MAGKLDVIAHIHTPYPEKFGIPRQSGLADTAGTIVFVPKYRNPDAVRGIEEFSHLWLLWDFSEVRQERFIPLVSPPRLGGKEKRGVFATRSPFRPNGIGLSCVRLSDIRQDAALGPVLTVLGADLMDGTPIYDIKPYLPYADSHPEAKGGFGQAHAADGITVDFPEDLLALVREDLRETLIKVLALDPRAAYNKKPDYVYGMAFSVYDIRFVVENGVLTVLSVVLRDEADFHNIKGQR